MRKHVDQSGDKPYKVLQQSRSYTHVDGTNDEASAKALADSTVGDWTNAGASGEWEPYYSCIVTLDDDVIYRAFPKREDIHPF